MIAASPARRLLVVDDHAAFRAAARAMLSRAFDVVGEASDGRSTLDETERLAPDIVVLDVGLPDLNGAEVCAELMRRHPALQVVLVSVRDLSDYGEQLDGCGAAGFVPKARLSPGAIEALLRA